MTEESSVIKVQSWLQERHDLILGKEKAAYACLNQGDQEGYARELKAKGELLANLAKDAREPLQELPSAVAKALQARLKNFSATAAYGLKLNSLFFLSALLYKDEHPVGEPDNFQVLIDEFRSKGLAFS
ncbi:MAG: hypothetical protein IJS50_04045 [Desulfovibrio sp.]|nr:hypothetical protein [Desulfovibrio sp.]